MDVICRRFKYTSQYGAERGVVRNFGLLLVSIVVSLLLAEGASRLVGFEPRQLSVNPFFQPGRNTTWSVPDPELGWINREGVSVSIEAGNAPMTFWSEGRRASRLSPDTKLQGTPVLLIGGSNAQSYGVRDEESFPYLLAQTMPDMWLENFGTGGFGTVQAMMMAERVLDEFYSDEQPKLILVTFADSHMTRNVSDQSWVFSISDTEGRYVSPPHYRLNGDDLSFEPFRTIGLWPLESRSAVITVLHNFWLQSNAYNTANQALEVTRRVFIRLNALAQAHDAKLIAIVLEDYKELAVEVFDGMPFPVIDCSGFERSDPQQYLLGGGSHPNPRLHAHFAGCIGPVLKEELAGLEAKP